MFAVYAVLLWKRRYISLRKNISGVGNIQKEELCTSSSMDGLLRFYKKAWEVQEENRDIIVKGLKVT